MNAPSSHILPLEDLWRLRLEETAKTLRKRGFTPHIVPDIPAAAALVMQDLLPESGAKTVAFGGSMTILQADLFAAMQAEPSVTVIDTLSTSEGLEAMLEKRREALLCDLYLCSVNALTHDGVLMLLDGFGNRTASVQFGPRQVVILAGRNKLTPTTESGYERVFSIAAPANGLRLKKNTPCTKTGRCMHCNAPDSMCSFWTLIQRDPFPGRIHVVLINQDAGF